MVGAAVETILPSYTRKLAQFQFQAWPVWPEDSTRWGVIVAWHDVTYENNKEENNADAGKGEDEFDAVQVLRRGLSAGCGTVAALRFNRAWGGNALF
jgi:hypothetical protein